MNKIKLFEEFINEKLFDPIAVIKKYDKSFTSSDTIAYNFPTESGHLVKVKKWLDNIQDNKTVLKYSDFAIDYHYLYSVDNNAVEKILKSNIPTLKIVDKNNYSFIE
jgi:hypothetical protein